MGSKIKVLSEETINQIAAGEVIEHPASVVKELVENSLDAGSTHITVEVLSGGFQLIRITDNGSGMSQDDAILSLERHATSKVVTIEDLLYVSSMGFRGEALASISSISKLTILTNAHKEEMQGVRVVCEGGKIKELETYPRVQGTTMEVKSLFYTVPARKKFQKSPAQALSDIHKMLSTLALSRPDVHFCLISHDERLIETVQTTMKGRMEELLGKEYAKQIIPVTYEEPWIKVEGFIGSPTQVRSNRTGQYVFINKRSVSSPAISYAVSDGYGTMLGIKKYPVFVLHLTLNTELLDVNVHPQKKEVRFKEEGLLKAAVRKAVALSLQAGESSPACIDSEKCFQQHPSFFFSDINNKKLQDVKTSCVQNSKEFHVPLLDPAVELLPSRAEVALPIQDLHVIGIHQHYLLLDGKSVHEILRPPYLKPPYNGLIILDLQGAAARIYFDAVMSGDVAAKAQMLNVQALLFPIKISVTAAEALILEEQLPLIKSLGIEMRAFGKNLFVIDACASYLDEERIKELLEEFLEEHKTASDSALDRQKKIAIRSSQIMRYKKSAYHVEEAKKIVSSLLKISQSYFCPLGKKIISYLSFEDYAKLFTK